MQVGICLMITLMLMSVILPKNVLTTSMKVQKESGYETSDSKRNDNSRSGSFDCDGDGAPDTGDLSNGQDAWVRISVDSYEEGSTRLDPDWWGYPYYLGDPYFQIKIDYDCDGDYDEEKESEYFSDTFNIIDPFYGDFNIQDDFDEFKFVIFVYDDDDDGDELLDYTPSPNGKAYLHTITKSDLGNGKSWVYDGADDGLDEKDCKLEYSITLVDKPFRLVGYHDDDGSFSQVIIFNNVRAGDEISINLQLDLYTPYDNISVYWMNQENYTNYLFENFGNVWYVPAHSQPYVGLEGFMHSFTVDFEELNLISPYWYTHDSTPTIEWEPIENTPENYYYVIHVWGIDMNGYNEYVDFSLDTTFIDGGSSDDITYEIEIWDYNVYEMKYSTSTYSTFVLSDLLDYGVEYSLYIDITSGIYSTNGYFFFNFYVWNFEPSIDDIQIYGRDSFIVHTFEPFYIGANIYDLDGDPLTYRWDFNDGNTVENVYASHIYTDPGEYYVTITVGDGIDTTEKGIYVTVSEFPYDSYSNEIEISTKSQTTSIDTDYSVEFNPKIISPWVALGWPLNMRICFAFEIGIKLTHTGGCSLYNYIDFSDGNTIIDHSLESSEGEYTFSIYPKFKIYYQKEGEFEICEFEIPIPTSSQIYPEQPSITIGDTTIYYWDRYVELEGNPGLLMDFLNVEHFFEETLTLLSIDLWKYIRAAADGLLDAATGGLWSTGMAFIDTVCWIIGEKISIVLELDFDVTLKSIICDELWLHQVSSNACSNSYPTDCYSSTATASSYLQNKDVMKAELSCVDYQNQVTLENIFPLISHFSLVRISGGIFLEYGYNRESTSWFGLGETTYDNHTDRIKLYDTESSGLYIEDYKAQTILLDNCITISNFRDLDNDGTIDRDDEDIDGDGCTNEWEISTGTDIYDPNSKDTDGDGYIDSEDVFPLDKTEWLDFDKDGRGDNSDAFPLDLSASIDSDSDGYPDEWNDGKSESDSTSEPKLRLDAFFDDPAASLDTDGDGYPDEWNKGKSESDSTTDLKLDAFPKDKKEWLDSDSDDIGDNSDAFPLDPSASIDTDEDGYPDEWNEGKSKLDSTTNLTRLDAFPSDPAASLDNDGDGYPDEWNSGMSQADSTTGLTLDAFPQDLAASIDSDKDGYPDKWIPGKSEKDSTTGLKLDAYPRNVNKWQDDEEMGAFFVTDTRLFIFGGIGVLFVIICIIAIIVIIRSKKRKKIKLSRQERVPKNQYITSLKGTGPKPTSPNKQLPIKGNLGTYQHKSATQQPPMQQSPMQQSPMQQPPIQQPPIQQPPIQQPPMQQPPMQQPPMQQSSMAIPKQQGFQHKTNIQNQQQVTQPQQKSLPVHQQKEINPNVGMNRCPRCNTEIEPDWFICPNCKIVLETLTKTTSLAPLEIPQPNLPSPSSEQSGPHIHHTQPLPPHI